MKYLYHATFPTRVDSIAKEGILCGYNPFGVVFACDSMKDLGAFIHSPFNRWRHEFTKELEEQGVTEHGEVVKVPKIIYHDKVAIFQIDVSKLDEEKISESDDHSPFAFNASAYVYQGDIPPEAILGVAYINFGDDAK